MVTMCKFFFFFFASPLIMLAVVRGNVILISMRNFAALPRPRLVPERQLLSFSLFYSGSSQPKDPLRYRGGVTGTPPHLQTSVQ